MLPHGIWPWSGSPPHLTDSSRFLPIHGAGAHHYPYLRTMLNSHLSVVRSVCHRLSPPYSRGTVLLASQHFFCGRLAVAVMLVLDYELLTILLQLVRTHFGTSRFTIPEGADMSKLLRALPKDGYLHPASHRLNLFSVIGRREMKVPGVKAIACSIVL